MEKGKYLIKLKVDSYQAVTVMGKHWFLGGVGSIPTDSTVAIIGIKPDELSFVHEGRIHRVPYTPVPEMKIAPLSQSRINGRQASQEFLRNRKALRLENLSETRRQPKGQFESTGNTHQGKAS